jgi:hypothetical protein
VNSLSSLTVTNDDPSSSIASINGWIRRTLMYCSAHESSTEVSGDKVVLGSESVSITVSAGTSALLVFAIVFRKAFAVK